MCHFLHVVAGRTAAADYLGVWAMDPSVHEERTANLARSEFDAEVEVRRTDTGREARALGLPGVDEGWHAL